MSTQPEPARHDKCGARGHQTGEPCGLPAGWGTSHVGVGNCRKHLGNAPNNVQHARQLQAEDAALRFGVPVQTTASDALLHELCVSRGIVDFIRARLAALPQDEMTFGSERVTRRQRQPGGGERVIEDTSTVRSRPHVWWGLLDQAQRHHAQVAAEIARLGIEERRVQLAEAQAELFYSSLIRAFALLGVSDDDRTADVILQVMGEVVAPGEDGDGGELFATAAPGDRLRCALPLQARGSRLPPGAGNGGKPLRRLPR
jgi:hypothetical protein